MIEKRRPGPGAFLDTGMPDRLNQGSTDGWLMGGDLGAPRQQEGYGGEQQAGMCSWGFHGKAVRGVRRDGLIAVPV